MGATTASSRLALAVACALVASCGGAPSRPVQAPNRAAKASASAVPTVTSATPVVTAAPTGLPGSCAPSDSGVCVPSADFAKRMCSGAFADVGLALMAKDSPFTHLYMRGDVDAWNADGGTSTRAKLRFDEEVLALRRRSAPKGGIVVSSAGGGYLVMRWDGDCFTLDDSEITAKKPPAPKHAPIHWRLLGGKTRDALLADAKVLAAYNRRGKECKGATSGDVTKSCEQADAALGTAIVAAVRGGLAMPTPDRLP